MHCFGIVKHVRDWTKKISFKRQLALAQHAILHLGNVRKKCKIWKFSSKVFAHPSKYTNSVGGENFEHQFWVNVFQKISISIRLDIYNQFQYLIIVSEKLCLTCGYGFDIWLLCKYPNEKMWCKRKCNTCSLHKSLAWLAQLDWPKLARNWAFENIVLPNTWLQQQVICYLSFCEFYCGQQWHFQKFWKYWGLGRIGLLQGRRKGREC